MTDYTELRAKAEAATPGPWNRVDFGGNRIMIHIGGDEDAERSRIACVSYGNTLWPAEACANAAYIAAASPDVVLRLIAIADAAQRLASFLTAAGLPDDGPLEALREALEGAP